MSVLPIMNTVFFFKASFHLTIVHTIASQISSAYKSPVALVKNVDSDFTDVK